MSNISQNADGTYTLTLAQIEEISNGKIKLINGRLYLDASQILKEASVFNNRKDFTHESFHSAFNRPTQSQIERFKQLPPVEIKGVNLKDSKLSPETQTAVKTLISEIHEYPDKHPFEWVRVAQCYTEWAGEEAKPLLLEILNSVIPLKEGMKLEGFSALEFDKKFLYSLSNLLEESYQELKRVDAGYKPTFNMIDAKTHENLGPLNPTAEDLVPHPVDMNNLVVQDPTYLSVGVEGLTKVSADTKELEQVLKDLYYNGNYGLLPAFHFIEHAKMLYEDYKLHVHMLDKNDPDLKFTKWSIAIYLQSLYWESFRGKTITILKLFNKCLNPDNELYHLETPITGMKKR